MTSVQRPAPLPFGTLLGVAPGGVPAYSSDYASVDERLLPDRSAYRNYVDGIYMGFKWQCVEFARRWMYINKGWIFDDVAMAYEIFNLKDIWDVKSDRRLPLRAFKNGSPRHPEPGCLLVWSEGGEFERTGHVAVVTEVTPEYVRIAEQNVGHQAWPEGADFAREISARVTADGGYWVRCSFGDATILGWVVQTDEEQFAYVPPPPDPHLFRIAKGTVTDEGRSSSSWLNEANPDEAAYVQMMGSHLLAAQPENQFKYFVVSESAITELRRATNELHAMFLHATERVLHDDSLLERFNLPRIVWPRIKKSWANRRNQLITGRLDFAMTEQGLKVYEYNCDSASCHMDAGKIQGKWAAHFGVDVGRDAGQRLFADLAAAWRESEAKDASLHLMIDRDLEETYHGLFMQDVLNAAGIPAKLQLGMQGLHWLEDGTLVDADGEPIMWVWKSWMWETALDQIRAELEQDGSLQMDRVAGHAADRRAPRLVDVLFRPEVMVYEPLWTLIPSNKAILPVLWELFPDHPYLLRSSYELTDQIRADGYVQKPIVGRCGANIALYDERSRLLEETDGKFDSPHQVYQELFPLPRIGDDYVQLCTFTAGGTYAGACVRIDRSMVITADSDLVALRVESDNAFLEHWADR